MKNNALTQIVTRFFSTGLLAVVALASDLANAQTAAPGTPSATAPAAPSFLMQLPVLIGFFALMYLLILRPQKQQQKKQAEVIASLKKGDEVVLTSGFLGTIVGLTDRIATVEIADGVETKVLRSQIQGPSKDVTNPA
jgi:preprotein translocase subunit YajC